MKTQIPATCRNCDFSIRASDTFCSHCGQKNTDGRITFGNLFSEFISTTFNLDSKIFRTLRDLFVPGKLTIQYFKGRHKRYVHPVRLFLVMIVLLIAAEFYQESDLVKIELGKLQTEEIQKQIQQNEYLDFIDSLAIVTPDSTSVVANFQQKIQDKYPSYKDSIIIGKEGMTIMGNLEIPISKKDYISLTEEELIDKYQVEGYKNRLIFKQQIRLLKDNKGFVNFFVKNIGWMLFAMMPFLALLLQLFFYKTKKYYVEHLVFTFHTHAFAFFILAFATLLFYDKEVGTIAILISISIILIYVFFSIWRVYEQNFTKTFFKTILINFLYVFLLSIFLILALLIELMIF